MEGFCLEPLNIIVSNLRIRLSLLFSSIRLYNLMGFGYGFWGKMGLGIPHVHFGLCGVQLRDL